MSRFYIEYFTRDMENPFRRVVSCDTLETVISKYLPHKETFSLPDYKEDGWYVSLTYYEWAEPIKDFMNLWYNEDIIKWYKNNLTDEKKCFISTKDPDPNKRALQRLKYNISIYSEFFIRTIFWYVETIYTILSKFRQKENHNGKICK